MSEEILTKAKAAGSPEELLRIAHDAGLTDFTEENARVYFNAINNRGELADEELDVSAGGCAVRAHGQKMVSSLNSCSHWTCDICNSRVAHLKRKDNYLPEEQLFKNCDSNDIPFPYSAAVRHCDNCQKCCDICYYCSYERSAWWCNNTIHYYE